MDETLVRKKEIEGMQVISKRWKEHWPDETTPVLSNMSESHNCANNN